MLIPVGFAQVTLIYAGTAVPNGAVNTFGVENSLAQSPTAIAGLIETNWSANIMPLITSSVTLVDVLVKLGPNASGATGTSGPGASGGDVINATPPNTAFLARKMTLLGGREGRGRLYIPGVDDADVSEGGFIEAAKEAAMQTGLDQVIVDLQADTIPMVLLHNSATPPTDVVELLIDKRVATQRRRLRR